MLNVDIFFDLRCVHGDAGMAEALWRGAFDAANGRADFAKLLVEAAGAVQPGLGWFGRFRTEQGRIDLKKAGLFGIVSAARALAIRYHVVELATPARLDGVKAALPAAESELEMVKDAHGVFIDMILAQQIDDIGRGVAPTNTVAVDRLERTRANPPADCAGVGRAPQRDGARSAVQDLSAKLGATYARKYPSWIART